MRQFTTDDIFGALRNVNLDQMNPPVAGRVLGDDEDCEYTVGGEGWTPSCLVGTIIYHLDPEMLHALLEGPQWSIQPEWARRNFTDDANALLTTAQIHADKRRGTWRQSLAAAGAYATTDTINTFS